MIAQNYFWHSTLIAQQYLFALDLIAKTPFNRSPSSNIHTMLCFTWGPVDDRIHLWAVGTYRNHGGKGFVQIHCLFIIMCSVLSNCVTDFVKSTHVTLGNSWPTYTSSKVPHPLDIVAMDDDCVYSTMCRRCMSVPLEKHWGRLRCYNGNSSEHIVLCTCVGLC